MMKKSILMFCASVLFSTSALANENCFIAKEGSKILKNEGECSISYSPESTFKIPLSLIGFDSGILKDETHPEWSFKEEYVSFLDVWKQPQTPTTWMKYSCIWYSQVLTKQLGMKKFQDYVLKLNYGNKDLTGDKGKNNGLTNAWLSSSLEISPNAQVTFIEDLLASKLQVSKDAQAKTRNILYVEDLSNGWKLYGKTGSGNLLSKDKTQKLEMKHGWYVGWIEKADKKIVFVNHIVDDKKIEQAAGPRAKEQAKVKLEELIKEIKN